MIKQCKSCFTMKHIRGKKIICKRCEDSLETKGYAQSGNPSDIQKSVQSPDTNSLENEKVTAVESESDERQYVSSDKSQGFSNNKPVVSLDSFCLSDKREGTLKSVGVSYPEEHVKEFIRLLKESIRLNQMVSGYEGIDFIFEDIYKEINYLSGVYLK